MDRKLHNFLNKKIFDKNNPDVYVVGLNADQRLHSAYYFTTLSTTTAPPKGRRRFKYYQSEQYKRNDITYYVYRWRLI
uniref:Uncharacterized protein n=1 Tax=Lymantria dispar multicapsid nuclear polyhedrosis virus TaxID=10449 RepID=A0A1B1MQW1_NPVLD|nr:hypothetical protein [Lymantria dispar multiple nucleopolyhedrovirus]